MFPILMLGSGVFWTATYVLIIRKSIQDRTYGMPLAALCANISWECIFSFLLPSPGIQQVVNIAWFLLDLGIVVCFLRYGRDEFADLSKGAFMALFGLTLATSFGAVLLVTLEFHDHGTYAAFGQNLMMSILFIIMLLRRRSLRGQSLSIALCKLIGTAFASLAFFLYTSISQHSILLPFLYVAILVYDLIYVALIYMLQRAARRTVQESALSSKQRELSL
ncbi:hypothetical protein EPA93_17500 [Ktedonosporobacter rubrisoli]|uniref:Uncharacterized protein n=1 Tax=Ktedonosporobacter rubrisoli TaxID=2509675 RepID=A0A4P6JQI4_KTERU|nr:hypothetical protein [Ktedonosporobacter rubrisoli]QBD77688.1 hypothetical protein EPA93_17500 [Ktedonosporobacter rubrisoli]